MKFRNSMIDMICREMELRSSYLKEKKLNTIYFGGGTPSVLSTNELIRIFDTIHKFFLVESNAEITLEANPDNLTNEKLSNFLRLGINRLSIGIQSFHDPHLKFLNRIHSGEDAEKSVNKAKDAGFNNISIDLIYGIESDNHNIWENDLKTAMALNISHISSYCLTIEKGTAFGNWLKNKKIKPIDDEFAAVQFEILIDRLSDFGMEQYEISNFSLPNLISKHNSNYWLGGMYLGVGPSAHSYDGKSRQFNVANNAEYIQSIHSETIPFQREELSPIDVFNEELMTGLRTKWGFDLSKWEYNNTIPRSFPREKMIQYSNSGMLEIKNGKLILTRSGKLIADKITSDLFVGSL